MSGRECHWILTAGYSTDRGYAYRTMDGTTIVVPGETRGDVYNRLKRLACETSGVDYVNVLFFELVPNRLSE